MLNLKHVYILAILAAALAQPATAQNAAPGTPPPASQPVAAAGQPASNPAAPPAAAPRAFTGRYRRGPAVAPIRIVMFAGYQCPLCKTVEAEALRLASGRDDISLSVKHFPMCSECNPGAPNMHPAGCVTARAAEAAGKLHGVEGFWKMHEWLFSISDGRTAPPPAEIAPKIEAQVKQFGWDWKEFSAAMNDPEVDRLVRADIKEAIDLGLFFTPMVFINGVEIKGVTTVGQALTRAVQALDQAKPPAVGPENDVPPQAAQKYVDDWREAPRVPAGKMARWTAGQPDGSARVVIFGDYQLPQTKELWEAVQQNAKGKPVRVEWRHFPFNSACNKQVKNPNGNTAFGCDAARATEAAGLLGGAAAFWRMHDFLLAHQPDLGPQLWAQAATACGLDPQALQQQMASPAVQALLDEDVAAGAAMQLKGVPSVYVNGRGVPRWKLEGANPPIIQSIIAEALQEKQ